MGMVPLPGSRTYHLAGLARIGTHLASCDCPYFPAAAPKQSPSDNKPELTGTLFSQENQTGKPYPGRNCYGAWLGVYSE